MLLLLFYLLPNSYHCKDLAASNQTSRRLQAAELERMQQELALVQQQLDTEASVRAAAVGFLHAKAGSHQESVVAWHARCEEDLLSKERDVEVRQHLQLPSPVAELKSRAVADCVRVARVSDDQKLESAGVKHFKSAVTCA